MRRLLYVFLHVRAHNLMHHRMGAPYGVLQVGSLFTEARRNESVETKIENLCQQHSVS